MPEGELMEIGRVRQSMMIEALETEMNDVKLRANPRAGAR